MSSPTQRSLAKLRAEGWTVAIVEKWNPHAKIRQDLFGCIDLLAMRDGVLLGIQATSTTNMNARVEKSKPLLGLREWLRTGALFQVWGWSKKGARNKRKLWVLDIQQLVIGFPIVSPSIKDAIYRITTII